MSGLTTPKTTLPAAIKPMLARLTRRPFDSPDHIFELKWDGIRALAFVEGGRLRLQDRNLRDITSRFPELAQPCEFMETDGCAFFQATCDHGLEGIVAKDRSSRYLPGKRNSRWLKVKRVRECEFVVAGYTVGGKRTGQFQRSALGPLRRGEEAGLRGQRGGRLLQGGPEPDPWGPQGSSRPGVSV